MAEGQRDERRAGSPFDPSPHKVRYSPRWLIAGAAVGALSLLALSRGGLPAAALFGAAGLSGAAYALLYEPRHPRLEQITLSYPDLPAALDGLRIGQLSDMHLGHRYALANTRWAVQQVQAAAPDLIALTGDFVSYAEQIDRLPELLRPLNAPLGVYAIAGNHDHWEGVARIGKALSDLGFSWLMNRSEVVEWGGAKLAIAGVDDIWDGVADLPAALRGLENADFRLLLCHAPDLADEAAAAGVELQLSGHTHGGHVRLPWLGSFALPRYGWNYQIGHANINQMQLYVSRGLGGMPLRLGSPPEATIITLRRG